MNISRVILALCAVALSASISKVCAQSEQYVAPLKEGPQEIKDQSGGMFMEEEQTAPKPASPKKIPLDLSNVGVPVDPSGNIIPLLDRSHGAVRPIYSQTEVYNEPAWNFLPQTPIVPYGQPLYPMPYPAYPMPYAPQSTGIRLGKNLTLNFGSNSPYWGSPYSNYGSPYAPFSGGYPPYMTNRMPVPSLPYGGYAPFAPTSAFQLPYGTQVGGYAPAGPFTAPPSGLGFGLFAPSTTQWQSTTTFKPLDLNLQPGN